MVRRAGTSTPLIINVALTGMVPTKEMTPHVPVSVEEILDDVAACAAAGASIVHVHARDDDGVPTTRAEAFAPIVSGIRDIDPALIVCVTCSGRGGASLEERGEVLDLDGAAKPDMASLTVGSNNFISQASVNAPATIVGLAEKMQRRGIKPELEAFEPGMVAFGSYLASKGLIEDPGYVNLILGNLGTSPVTALALGAFLEHVPAGWVWAVGGIGRFQLQANGLGVALGGHVRVGVEDNIWFDTLRTKLATNAELVGRVAELARLLERPVATARQAREMLAL